MIIYIVFEILRSLSMPLDTVQTPVYYGNDSLLIQSMDSLLILDADE